MKERGSLEHWSLSTALQRLTQHRSGHRAVVHMGARRSNYSGFVSSQTGSASGGSEKGTVPLPDHWITGKVNRVVSS